MSSQGHYVVRGAMAMSSLELCERQCATRFYRLISKKSIDCRASSFIIQDGRYPILTANMDPTVRLCIWDRVQELLIIVFLVFVYTELLYISYV